MSGQTIEGELLIMGGGADYRLPIAGPLDNYRGRSLDMVAELAETVPGAQIVIAVRLPGDTSMIWMAHRDAEGQVTEFSGEDDLIAEALEEIAARLAAGEDPDRLSDRLRAWRPWPGFTVRQVQP